MQTLQPVQLKKKTKKKQISFILPMLTLKKTFSLSKIHRPLEMALTAFLLPKLKKIKSDQPMWGFLLTKMLSLEDQGCQT